MNIIFDYDQSMDMKVYLSTDSTSANLFGLTQPNSEVTVDNFVKNNSALVLNTHDSDTNGGKTLTVFEDLGLVKNLKYNSDDEMEFYVYVENYSETETVYYRANINFTGDNETAPFSTVTNPDYELAETAGGGVALPRAY